MPNILPFRLDVQQAELIIRLEKLDKDNLITVLDNAMILYLEIQFGQPLSKAEIQEVYDKATELVYKLEEGAPMPYIVQQMRQFLKDMLRYTKIDITWRDFLSALQTSLPAMPVIPSVQDVIDVLPSVQDVANTYVEVLLAPVAVASALVPVLTNVLPSVQDVKDVLPSVQDVKDAYVEVLFAPVEVVSALGSELGQKATVVLGEALDTLGQSAVDTLKSSFSEERNLAYVLSLIHI